MSQGRNVGMPESGDAMSHRSASLSIVPRGLRVLKSLPGVFPSDLVILLFVRIRGSAVSVGGTLVQFGSSLMILVVRSVVMTSRHL